MFGHLKPRSPENPFLFIKIQALNEIIWFEKRRTNRRTPWRLSLSLSLSLSLLLCTFRFHEIDPSLSSFLRFKTIIPTQNRYEMKRSTSCKFVELLHPPCNVPGWQFFELLSQPSLQKQVNMQPRSQGIFPILWDREKALGTRLVKMRATESSNTVQNVCAWAKSLFSKSRLRMRTSQQERFFWAKIELY